jgi:hypothetical protein
MVVVGHVERVDFRVKLVPASSASLYLYCAPLKKWPHMRNAGVWLSLDRSFLCILYISWRYHQECERRAPGTGIILAGDLHAL